MAVVDADVRLYNELEAMFSETAQNLRPVSLRHQTDNSRRDLSVSLTARMQSCRIGNGSLNARSHFNPKIELRAKKA